MSLKDLIDETRTDKNNAHSYLETYESLFISKKDSATNILEIGIYHGGSIKLWYDYFQNAKVYGLDIMLIKDVWPELKNKERIILCCFDAYQTEFFNNNMMSLQNQFDILIDDGPHTLESMIFFIKNYSKLLKDDGILIVEDIQDISWVDELRNHVPEHLKEFIEIYDLREKKNRYDDILFVINKNK